MPSKPEQWTVTKKARNFGRISTVFIVAAFYYFKQVNPDFFPENPVLIWAPAVAVPLAFWGKTLLLRVPASLAVGFAMFFDVFGVLSLLDPSGSGLPGFFDFIIPGIIISMCTCGGVLAYIAGNVIEEEPRRQ